METKAWFDTTGTTSSLDQVVLRGPYGSVVCHVVVRSEKLHLGFARVDDEDDVIDGDRCLSDIR